MNFEIGQCLADYGLTVEIMATQKWYSGDILSVCGAGSLVPSRTLALHPALCIPWFHQET